MNDDELHSECLCILLIVLNFVCLLIICLKHCLSLNILSCFSFCIYLIIVDFKTCS